MIGRGYTTYRHKRSFRKSYYVIFFVIAFFLWQSESLKRHGHDNAQENLPQELVQRTAQEDGDPGPPRVIDVYGRHVHTRPKALDDALPETQAAPSQPPLAYSNFLVRDDDLRLRKEAADVQVSSTNDDAEVHRVDSVEKIKDSTGDTMEHGAMLVQADDDDTAVPNPDFPSLGGEQQIQFKEDGSSKKSQAEILDEILGADHPSKHMESHSGEDDVDADEAIDVRGDNTQHPIDTLEHQTPWSEHYSFPTREECEGIKDRADSLPDMLYVPFEQSVKDVTLEGWEDEWVSKARFVGPKLKEPKIDFVYNCEYSFIWKPSRRLNDLQG